MPPRQPRQHPAHHIMTEDSAKRACLAAALMDVPEDGAAYETVPSAWRVLFSSQQADSAVFSGLLSSCRTGRTWALSTAPKMTVQLTPPQEDQADLAAWQDQLSGVSDALHTRGMLPTCLAVCVKGESVSATALKLIPAALSQFNAGITALRVRLTEQATKTDRLNIRDYLNSAAKAFPNVTSLELDTCVTALPVKCSFPNLKHLRLTTSSTDPSVPAKLHYYLKQITELEVYSPARASKVTRSKVFNHAPSPSLRTLKTSACLTDPLLSRITRYAPNVAYLSVGGIDKGLSDHSAKQWGLKRLNITVQEGTGMDMSVLLHLPHTTEGVMDVGLTGGGRLYMDVKSVGVRTLVMCSHTYRSLYVLRSFADSMPVHATQPMHNSLTAQTTCILVLTSHACVCHVAPCRAMTHASSPVSPSGAS